MSGTPEWIGKIEMLFYGYVWFGLRNLALR